MKFSLTKIVSFILAVSILYSSSAYAVAMHFCCSELIDISILGEAKTCSNETVMNGKFDEQCTINPDNKCCSSQTFVKEIEDISSEIKITYENDGLVFLYAFYHSYLNLFRELKKNVIPFKDYHAPLLCRDIQLLNETYLI